MDYTGKRYVFVSYSTADMEFVKYVTDLLSSLQVDYWKAPESIPAGSSYAREIVHAIENCSLFLIIFSKHAQGSIWVEKEVDCALTYGRDIFPLNIDDTMLNDAFKFYLNNVQMIFYSQSPEKSVEILKSKLEPFKGGMGKPLGSIAYEKAEAERIFQKGSTAPEPAAPIMPKAGGKPASGAVLNKLNNAYGASLLNAHGSLIQSAHGSLTQNPKGTPIQTAHGMLMQSAHGKIVQNSNVNRTAAAPGQIQNKQGGLAAYSMRPNAQKMGTNPVKTAFTAAPNTQAPTTVASAASTAQTSTTVASAVAPTAQTPTTAAPATASTAQVSVKATSAAAPTAQAPTKAASAVASTAQVPVKAPSAAAPTVQTSAKAATDTKSVPKIQAGQAVPPVKKAVIQTNPQDKGSVASKPRVGAAPILVQDPFKKKSSSSFVQPVAKENRFVAAKFRRGMQASDMYTLNRIPASCIHCGAEVKPTSNEGVYRCVTCGAENYDDFQTIRNYIRDHGAQSPLQISSSLKIPLKIVQNWRDLHSGQ
ncbi:MAG: TIR domain-containing protein [Lachnospiraceae bacterium]|nr:TIR domain-containing protein [Lachnospiraceae bacterium]